MTKLRRNAVRVALVAAPVLFTLIATAGKAWAYSHLRPLAVWQARLGNQLRRASGAVCRPRDQPPLRPTAYAVLSTPACWCAGAGSQRGPP